MGGISQDQIATVLERTDIVALIQKHLTLKRSGNNYLGLCPFHQEKTPSFSVNAKGQFYYCFGCNAKGNAITFLMEYRGMSFLETMDDLSALAGVTLTKTNSPAATADNHHYTAMEYAAAFFSEELTQHQPAIDYLRKRGINHEVQTQFALGYAPPGSTLTVALNKKNITTNMLRTLGLSSSKGGYDFFQNRLMIPIKNRKGQIVGFGGRTLSSDPSQAKYINSPDSPIFNKKRELFLGHLFDREHDTALVVEGYFDAIACTNADIKNTVAVLGTALSDEQVHVLKRRHRTVIFCYDGDQAGQNAMSRTLSIVIKLATPDCDFRFISLGATAEGEKTPKDPDEFIRQKGGDAFRQVLTTSMDLAQAITHTLNYNAAEDTLTMRTKKIDQARAYVNLAHNPSVATALQSALEQAFNLPFELSHSPAHAPDQSHNIQGELTLSAKIIYSLYLFPTLANIASNPQYLGADPDDHHHQLLRDFIDYLEGQPGITPQTLVSNITNSTAPPPEHSDEQPPLPIQGILPIITLASDLNLEREAVLKEFEDIINYWLVVKHRAHVKKIAMQIAHGGQTDQLRSALKQSSAPKRFTIDSTLKKQLLR